MNLEGKNKQENENKQTQTSHRRGKVTAVIPQDRKVEDVDTTETELQVGQCPRHRADRREAKDTQHMKDVWGTLAEAATVK